MRHSIPVVALLLAAAVAPGDDKLAGKACRSVHLNYPAPAEATAFTNAVTVEASAPGTYFCACGFQHGYFGIQEQAGGQKVAIFSVWEPGKQNDQQGVPEERRVKLVARGPGVRVGRFGNEGTGGQSFVDVPWQPGQTVRFRVTAARLDADRATYAGEIQPPGKGDWQLVATFSTPTKDVGLRGLYSFVEDFRRNGASLGQARSAYFHGGRVTLADGKAVELLKAKFTADSNPSLAVDASVDGPRFRLATGGTTANANAKLGTTLERAATP